MIKCQINNKFKFFFQIPTKTLTTCSTATSLSAAAGLWLSESPPAFIFRTLNLVSLARTSILIDFRLSRPRSRSNGDPFNIGSETTEEEEVAGGLSSTGIAGPVTVTVRIKVGGRETISGLTAEVEVREASDGRAVSRLINYFHFLLIRSFLLICSKILYYLGNTLIVKQ